MNEVLTLIPETGPSRVVLCGVRSIGMREFYQASASDFHPEVKFVLADYLDYSNERRVKYEGDLAPAGVYRILRTYRVGQELELTAELAPVEDGELYG